jgi:hypothetical protein
MPQANGPKGRRPRKVPRSSAAGHGARAPGARAARVGTPERPRHDYVAEVSEHLDVRCGVPLPFGPHKTEGGVNFAFFSRHASRVRLELFDRPEDATPTRVIDLDPVRNRTGDVWHVWVDGIRSGQLYAYRVDGPYEPAHGYRFNFTKLLLDPCATAITRLPNLHWRRVCDLEAETGLIQFREQLPKEGFTSAVTSTPTTTYLRRSSSERPPWIAPS